VATLPTARERLVTAAVAGVDRLTRHPLFLRIVDVDPELLLPYITTRRGAFQRAVVGAMEARLEAGVADDSIAVADRAAAARTIELTLRGFAFQTLAPGAEGERAQELAELSQLLDGYLAPERGRRARAARLALPGDETLAAGQARASRTRRRKAAR
jgi:hypothetical protein